MAEPLANGRGYAAVWNEMKEGSNVLPKIWLALAPRELAAAFSASGWSAAPSHLPVSSRYTRTWNAAIVSAVVNAQWPAR